MPAGGGGGPDYFVIRALEDFLASAGIQMSPAEVYKLYNETKAGMQNSNKDFTILQPNGNISREFMGQFLGNVNQTFASNNTPSELSGGYVGGSGGTTTTDFTPPDYNPDGGDAKSKAEAKFNTRVGFLSVLQTLGIPMDSNMKALIQQAMQNGWNQTTFQYFLKQTPEYRKSQAEAGGMSEAERLATTKQYQDIASQAGIDISPNTISWLFKNKVSPSEFADRAGALSQLQSNPEYYAQFAKTLHQMGETDHVPSKGELLTYIMGEGNSEWKNTENLLNARYAATQAGLKIKKDAQSYISLNPSIIQKIANKGLDQSALASGFQAVEQGAREVLPNQEAVLYGASKKDLVTAAFGGKGRSKAMADIKRAGDTAAAFSEERAAPTVAVDQSGELTIYGGGMQGGATR